MIAVNLPHGQTLSFQHVVFDYNGTLAVDGRISPEAKTMLAELAAKIPVTVITADTFGLAGNQLEDVPGVKLIILAEKMDGKQKARYIVEVGAGGTVAVGNGVNDKPMFDVAALSICVIGPEGANGRTLMSADIVAPSPEAALGLLLNPARLVATLRR